MVEAIQFIGTQRSGSNLLRLILNQHDLISAPHPPHLLQTFVPLLSHYKSTYGDDLKPLIEDMCQWVENNPVPWTQVNLDRDAISKNATSIYEVFREIYRQKAHADKAEMWCCKSTFNIKYVHQLEETIKPFYIHLYRDGRDVAASFKKVIVGHKHAYHLAKQWDDEQWTSIKFLENIEEERKIHISYETLIEMPDEVIGKICQKLGIEYSSNMLRYYNSEESHHTAESGKMWEAVIKPIMKNNHDKFRSELSKEEVVLYEKVAGNALERLGYERLYSGDNNVVIDVEHFDLLNKKLIEEKKKNATKKELEKRMQQESLLQEIKKKLNVVEAL